MVNKVPEKVYVKRVAYDNVYPTSGTSVGHFLEVAIDCGTVVSNDELLVTTYAPSATSIKSVLALRASATSMSGSDIGILNSKHAGETGTCKVIFKGNSLGRAHITLLCSEDTQEI